MEKIKVRRKNVVIIEYQLKIKIFNGISQT